MKFTFYLLIGMTALSNSVLSGNTDFGIENGIAFSNQSWKLGNTHILRYNGLITSNFEVSSHLFIQGSIGFTNKGTGLRKPVYETYLENIVENDLRIITFRIMVGTYLLNGKYKPYIKLGPRLEKTMSYNTTYQYGETADPRNPKNFSTLFYGITSGVGIYRQFGQIKVGLGLQFDYDFTNLVNKNSQGLIGTEIPKVKNSAIMLNLSILYSFGSNE